MDVEFEERVAPLLWACSSEIVAFIYLLGIWAAEAFVAQPLNAADAHSVIVSARILMLFFFISDTTPFCWCLYITKPFWDAIVMNMFFMCS